MTASLTIVIVNWNSGPLLEACVRSLERLDRTGFTIDRITIIDNASTDRSAEVAAPAGFEIIRNATNRGFAAACNQGAAGATSSHLLFLNPDTRVEPGTLAACFDFLAGRAPPGVGVLGVKLLNDAGEVARSCARFPTSRALVGHALGLDRIWPRLFPPHFLLEWDHGETRIVDQVMGAFLLIERRLFAALGGFDERFFVYWEDADLALRARAGGALSVYCAETAIVHKGCGTTDAIRARRLALSWESRLLFAFKHYGLLAALAVALTTVLLEPWARIALAVARGSIRDLAHVVQGWCILVARVPGAVARVRARRGAGRP